MQMQFKQMCEIKEPKQRFGNEIRMFERNYIAYMEGARD